MPCNRYDFGVDFFIYINLCMADASLYTLYDLVERWLRPIVVQNQLMQWNRFQLNAQTENSLFILHV